MSDPGNIRVLKGAAPVRPSATIRPAVVSVPRPAPDRRWVPWLMVGAAALWWWRLRGKS